MIGPGHRYMFDCHGFVVVRGGVIATQVERLRAAILAGRPAESLPWKFPVLDRGRPFWNALCHPVVLGLARLACGAHFRLDHAFGLSSNGAVPQLHGGRDSSQRSCSFHEVGPGEVLVGQLSVGICLEPQSSRTGGLCYIAGSHRAADRREGKEVLAEIAGGRFDHAFITVPALEPGDVVAFSESLVHGDTGWRGPRPRLQLYYKFAPGFVAWRDPAQQAKYLQYATNDIERALLAPPWTGRFDDDDGAMSVSNERRIPTFG